MKRVLTISKKHQVRETKAPFNRKYVSVPFINLAGKYLQTAGFEIGEKVEVEVKKDCLVIKRPTTKFMKMVAKNPHLQTLADTFNFKEVA